MTDRYHRQKRLSFVGDEGQQRIRNAKVCLIGAGALGAAVAEILVRGGVGRLVVADRDFVDVTNLQRQLLYDEDDAAAKAPKAEAAARKLRRINTEVEIVPKVLDVTPRNISALVDGQTIVVDGTDNLETRYLVNDACVSAAVPWVYGGAVGASGLVMTVIPGQGPCLRCALREPPPPGTLPTCDTGGVLASAPIVTASLQAAAALKIIVGDISDAGMLTRLDVWTRRFSSISIPADPDCPACAHRKFEFLNAKKTAWTTVLCGRNAVQITPPESFSVSFLELKTKLSPLGRVEDNGLLLTLFIDSLELVLFPDGRTVVFGTTDEAAAKSLVARIIGA